MNLISRSGVSVFAGLLFAATSFALDTTGLVVSYNNGGAVTITGNQPLVPGSVVLAGSDPITFTITGPSNSSLPYPLTINLAVTFLQFVAANPGETLTPAEQNAALGFCTLSSSTVTFSGPGAKVQVTVSVKVPTSVVVGSYSWKVAGTNWPGGVTDPGATINANVLPPISNPTVPPAIPSLLPANGSSFTYYALTPVQVPISFTATSVSAAAGGATIESLTAKFDTTPLILATTGLSTTNPNGTFSASGSVTPAISDAGQHTITVSATNAAGTTTAMTQINIILAPLAPNITNTNNPTFTYGQPGTFAVTWTGYKPPKFAVTAGTLPAGVTLNPTTGMLSGTPTTTAGSPIQLTITATNLAGSTTKSFTLTVNKAPQTITFAPLAPVKVGAAPFALTATASSGLTVSYTSDNPPVATVSGSTVTVVSAGTTFIKASQAGNSNYLAAADVPQLLTVQTSTGPTCGTAIVWHAPDLNGNAGVDGSLQVLLPESISLDGNVWISDSLLVPGTPIVKLNGHPIYGSTIDGSGNPAPSNYKVTLNGNVALGHLVRCTDAVLMPVIAAPPPSTGTRDVKLNKSSDSAGNFSTVRDLTVNGNMSPVAVPAGTYRDITVTGNGGLILGEAGATTPSVYNVRSLKFSDNSTLAVAGPVILTVANDATFNADVGNSDHPEWLALNLYRGDLKLDGSQSFFGNVLAPAGEVTINGHGTLRGGLICDSLTLSGYGLLDLCSDDNQSQIPP